MILPNLALQPPYAIEEKVWAEHKTELFVATALENLTADIAKGKKVGVSGLLGYDAQCSRRTLRVILYVDVGLVSRVG